VIRGNSAGQPGDARRGRPGWRGGGRKRVAHEPWGEDNSAGQDLHDNAQPPQQPIGYRQEPLARPQAPQGRFRAAEPGRAAQPPTPPPPPRGPGYRPETYQANDYPPGSQPSGDFPPQRPGGSGGWRSTPPPTGPAPAGPPPAAPPRFSGSAGSSTPPPSGPGPRIPYDPRTRAFDPQANGYQQEPTSEQPTEATQGPTGPQLPKKLTVTRVAAWRSRQLTQQGVAMFQRAVHADGARESGLASLNYAVMINYASSATMAVGLANTLFFSAATAESKTKVALYLLITVAPFALIAPVVGPLLDRIQRGRRIALATSCVGQGLLSVVMALHFNDWMLYPAALGTLVLSKSFDVLKAAVAPRVLPSGITLSKSNARLTVFGMAAGAVFGAFGTGFLKLFGSPGALWFTAVLCLADAVLCLRIPAWVEVTEGEVPASLRSSPRKKRRQPMGRQVVIALWGNGTIRLLTGFLMLFPAFVIKTLTEHSPGRQLLLLGLIGAAAGLGGFIGNGIGARLQFGKPDQVIIYSVAAAFAGAVFAAVLPGIGSAAIAALCASVASGLAKISLDATIQKDLPEASRASAFGRSETILQLSWVFGGAIGVLLPATFWLGFTVIGVLMAAGGTQTFMARRGGSLLPSIGGRLGSRSPAAGAPAMAFGADTSAFGTEPSYSPSEPGSANDRTAYQPTSGSSGPSPTKAMPTEHFDGPA
jgi:MFS family permease